ncbi:MAG: class I SAM-dependent methyltransferase [Akkermansiaceae bacterium]|jgi:tRNA G37 N-methylase Trm5
MFPPRPTHLLHVLLADIIQPGDTVIDATAGNGHDTVFLAEAVGDAGRVIAIDIQAEAISSTRRVLEEKRFENRVDLHEGSHAELAQYVAKSSVAAIVFNLGYLPGADHAVMTQVDSTLQALAGAVIALKEGGVLAVVCYPGHKGGDVESARVESCLRDLENFRLAKYELLSTQRASPFLLIACKKSDS